jgi:hypothetical protein
MVLFLLDKSGSMEERLEDTIGGFNSFIRNLHENSPEALVSLYTFSDRCTCEYSKVPVGEVKFMSRDSYVPAGNTALLDSIGKVIKEAGKDAEGLLVILTDGYENASRKYSKDHIKDLILLHPKLQVKYIGADLDQASDLGIHDTIRYDGANTPGIFRMISESVGSTYAQLRESQSQATV